MRLNKSFGLVQIPLLIGLLLMAAAIPLVTRLVQQNQENRGKAAANCGSGYYACNCSGDTVGVQGCCCHVFTGEKATPVPAKTSSAPAKATSAPAKATSVPAPKPTAIKSNQCNHDSDCDGDCAYCMTDTDKIRKCVSGCSGKPTYGSVKPTTPPAALTPISANCDCVNGIYKGTGCGHSSGLACPTAGACLNASCASSCAKTSGYTGSCSGNSCVCSAVVPTVKPIPTMGSNCICGTDGKTTGTKCATKDKGKLCNIAPTPTPVAKTQSCSTIVCAYNEVKSTYGSSNTMCQCVPKTVTPTPTVIPTSCAKEGNYVASGSKCCDGTYGTNCSNVGTSFQVCTCKATSTTINSFLQSVWSAGCSEGIGGVVKKCAISCSPMLLVGVVGAANCTTVCSTMGNAACAVTATNLKKGDPCLVNESCGAGLSCVGLIGGVTRHCVTKGDCSWLNNDMINGSSQCFNVSGGVGSQMKKCTNGNLDDVGTYAAANCSGATVTKTIESYAQNVWSAGCSEGIGGVAKKCAMVCVPSLIYGLAGAVSCNTVCNTVGQSACAVTATNLKKGDPCLVNESCGAGLSCVGLIGGVTRHCVTKGDCSWLNNDMINGSSQCFNVSGGVGSQMKKCTNGNLDDVGTYAAANCSGNAVKPTVAPTAVPTIAMGYNCNVDGSCSVKVSGGEFLTSINCKNTCKPEVTPKVTVVPGQPTLTPVPTIKPKSLGCGQQCGSMGVCVSGTSCQNVKSEGGYVCWSNTCAGKVTPVPTSVNPPYNPPKATATSGASGGGKCTQNCSGKTLRDCVQKDADGTSRDSICNAVGRVESCGGKNYCCPAVGGTWTTSMTKCPNAKCTQCVGHPDRKVKGDADCTGDTSINDYQIWIDEFKAGGLGQTNKNSWRADFDCNRVVDINDYQMWIDNFKKVN